MLQNNVILTKTESLTMNSRPKDPKTARNKNVLVIGGSGSGKTRFWLKPNLMQMHSSYVVTDPKGTILVECGKMLQRGAPKLGKDGKPMKDKHGKVIYEPYRIKVLNTINFRKSMHYNPFAYIHSEKDILKLVTTLIANTKGEGKAGDDFWVKAETLLYCALIGYIHYEAPVEEQNFSTLIEFINAMEVREDDEEFKNPVDLMFDALESEKPNHFAVRQYKKYKLAAGVVCSKRLLNQAVGKSLRTHNLKPKKGAQVMRKNEKITALYERLSRDDFGKDDDQQRESNSISNQKAMLEEFAARQGFTNIVHFTDDGISGTCFDRPGFLAMMKEVEAGNVEYLRTMPTLRPRTNTFNAAFRVRSVAAYAIHKFFQENGFVYAHSPLLTASDCEGAGEMFRVTTLDLDNVPKNEDGTVDYTKDFFEKPVNLTVSGQLEAEAMAMAFGKVYTFGPTFRAEKSFTTRHAAEFWMIEPEMAFCDLNGYMDTAEAMTKYVIRYVLDNCPDEMAFFNQLIDKGLIERLELVANSEFGRISYTDAIEILKKNNKKFQFPVEWGVDIQTEHERYLTEVVFKKPVFVTDYPKEIKSFYMKQNADGKTVAAADMLVPGIGELIGGSQREEDYDKLVTRMDELGLDKSSYDWYLNLRKFGGVEHAGYGLGFERMIMYLTGIQNIRDVLPFPRTAYGF